MGWPPGNATGQRDGQREHLTQAVLVAGAELEPPVRPMVCRPRTAAAGGRPQGRPRGCGETSPSDLTSTDTTERNVMLRVPPRRIGRAGY